MPSGTNASISKMINGVEVFTTSEGLTKLEYAAIEAMQSLMAFNIKNTYAYSEKDVAKNAVKQANALFDELEKQK